MNDTVKYQRVLLKLSGEALMGSADYGIDPVVISSPMCRCVETAQIAFGQYLTDPELRQKSLDDIHGQDAFLVRAAELLRIHRGHRPIVFVNHRPNIDSLTMELIEPGDLLVGSVTDAGEVEIVGLIQVEP